MTRICHPFLYFLLVFSCLFTTSCQESPASSSHSIKLEITGSSTIAPLVSEIGKRFEARNPHVRIDVQTGGSSRGIHDIQQGLADIGMISRALKPAEEHLHGTILAYDGIGIIVHESNPVSSLRPDDIRKIYTGALTNWEEVGGVHAPITVVTKAEGRGTLELFLNYFNLKVPQIKAHVVIGDNEQGIKTVAGNPHAIAYVSIGTAEYDASHDVPIKLLSLGKTPASLKEVASGHFPLSRPLTLITNVAPSGAMKAFLDFATSFDTHDLITKHYFVPFKQG